MKNATIHFHWLSGVVLGLMGTLLGMGSAAAQAKVTFPDRICNVRDYGAEGARLYPDTAAFQKAIDDCAAKGGGRVEVPRGVYLLGPIFLKSNIRFHLVKYAELQFETNPKLYGTTKHPVTPEGKWADLALINISNAENVAITGEGRLDGQGYVWWEWMRDYWRDSEAARSGKANQGQKVTRPRLVLARDSRQLLFEGVTFTNAPSFHIVLNHSDYITIRGTSILAPSPSPNTDAIDPTGSRHVLIENNTISCGDDIVAIKGTGFDPKYPDAVTANIVIRGNKIFDGHGVSIGSGTAGGVKHVLVENNTFEGSLHGFRIKTRRGFGGEVSDIVVRNNTMTNVRNVLTISGYFSYAPLDLKVARQQIQKGGFMVIDLFYPPDSDPAEPFVKDKTPDIHDVTIEGLIATGADAAGLIIGLPERAMKNILLKNVRIVADTGLVVRHARVGAEKVAITVKSGKPVILQKGGVFQKHEK